VLDALASLVAKSMVVLEEDGGSGTRYQLLETLRQYARERLDEAGIADETRRRHATHYCERAEALGPLLHGAGEIEGRRRIRADLDDLRAAVFWAADSESDGDLAVRVVAALATEQIQDQTAGVGSWAVRIADLARRSTPGRRMAALGAAASQAVTAGDYEAARLYAREAVVEPTPLDCPAPYFPYFALQEVEAYEGRPEEAYRLAERARVTLEEGGAEPYSVAMMYGLAAVWAVAAGDVALASAEGEEALRRGRALQNPTLVTTALFDLGWALADDEPERALALLEESIELTRNGAGDGVFAPTLTQAAAIWARLGDFPRAITALVEAIEFSLRGGLPVTLVGCLTWGIEILARSGRHEPAALLYGVVRLGPLESAIGGYMTPASWVVAVDLAMAALGAERFDALAAGGAAMSYEELVVWLRALLDDSSTETADG
jgi:tetratricopeptide (TPR) repeat protein